VEQQKGREQGAGNRYHPENNRNRTQGPAPVSSQSQRK
jgi:hypothetical protein